MKISIPSKAFEELTQNLISLTHLSEIDIGKNSSNSKFIYESILSSNLMPDSRIKDILKNHFNQNYSKSYQMLIYENNQDKHLNFFFDKLAKILLEIDYLEFHKTLLVYFNTDEEISSSVFSGNEFLFEPSRESKSLFDLKKENWVQSRINLAKPYNLVINKIISFNSSIADLESNQQQIHNLYIQLIDLLKENRKIFHSDKNFNSIFPIQNFNSLFIYSFTKFFSNFQKNPHITEINCLLNKNEYEVVEKVIERDEIFFNSGKNCDNNDTFFVSLDSTKEPALKYTLEDEKLNEKLNCIEENLNSINFEGEIPYVNRNSTHNDIQKFKNYSYEDNQTDHNKFLLKLKFFDILKKFYLHKRRHKINKNELKEREKISKIFYNNLLKSRSFFGILKWIKMLKNFRLINQNYFEYKIDFLSKRFLKNMIYVYNRKNLCDAISELREKKLKIKSLKILRNKTRFKINHNILYFSQLSNNQYSVKFLLKICDIVLIKINKNKNFKINLKKCFNTNFRKLNYVSELNEKRKIFNLLYKAKNSLKTSKEKISSLGKICLDHISKIRIKEFFSILRKNHNFKIKKEKFLKKIFLVRFYFKKYSKEIKRSKRKNQIIKMNEIKKKIFSKLFINLLCKKLQNFNQEKKNSKLTFHDKKLLTKTFQILRFYSILRKKKNYLNHKFMNRYHHKFFRNIKIIMIESLLIHGINQQINNYKKKNILSILIHSSVNKYKFTQSCLQKTAKIKNAFFQTLSNKKLFNKNFGNKCKKMFCQIFIKKVYLKKFLRFQGSKYFSSKILQFQKSLFFLFVKNRLKNYLILKNMQKSVKIKNFKKFFTKLKSKNSSQIKSLKHTISKSYENNGTKLFSQKIFFINFFYYNKSKQITNNQAKLFYFKKFNKKINCKITITALKLFKQRMKKLINSKLFFKKIFRQINFKNQLREMKELSQKLYASQILNQLNMCIKNKTLFHQIQIYHTIRIRKKIFNNFKLFYINQLKRKMLEERYMDFIKLKHLHILKNFLNKREIN